MKKKYGNNEGTSAFYYRSGLVGPASLRSTRFRGLPLSDRPSWENSGSLFSLGPGDPWDLPDVGLGFKALPGFYLYVLFPQRLVLSNEADLARGYLGRDETAYLKTTEHTYSVCVQTGFRFGRPRLAIIDIR